MPRVLGVDLAAVSSAACYLSEAGQVWDQFDSVNLGQDAFIAKVAGYVTVSKVYIEDMPPIKRFDWTCKAACILQGRIIERCTLLYPRDPQPTFIQPLRWIKHYGWESRSKSGTTAAYCKQVCLDMGYKPPEDIHGKLLQDYRSAYLIANYVRSHG